jgi:hypothetical protein
VFSKGTIGLPRSAEAATQRRERLCFCANGSLGIDVSASVSAKQASFVVGLRTLSETADVG